ncbi:MAG: hypothetical protein QNK37_36120 [Acidobacteriota bacterium]|nr:hypothetical protein [Acidobacteriota bacterium]
MIIRCDICVPADILQLEQSRRLASVLTDRGFRVTYAINRNGHEAARRYLGDEPTIYRVPEDDVDADMERMEHLQRHHGHRNLLVNLKRLQSNWLFRMTRRFGYTAVLDRGSRFMVYGDLIVNWSADARRHTYTCSPTARLLLGPKFYPADMDAHIDEGIAAPLLLLALGDDAERITPVLNALAKIGLRGPVDILCDRGNSPFELLGARAAAWPHLEPNPVHLDNPGAFPFHQYALAVARGDETCLELTARGVPTVTMALEKEELHTAYTLEQLGVAPTFGWHESADLERMVTLLVPLLTRVDRRQQYRAGMEALYEGGGLQRIAQFFPKEPELSRND